MKYYAHTFLLSAFFFSAGLSFAQANQTSSIGASDDCTDISIDFEASSNLTKQEQAERMDKAFLESLNKYERCQSAANEGAASKSAASGGNGGGTNKGENKGQGKGNGSNNDLTSGGRITSSPSTSMMGTNKKPIIEQATGTNSDNSQQGLNKKSSQQQTKSENVLNNGKIPGDIPPVDNDSVLEEQIRLAAINEKDPVIQEKLWNEYRRYKGLPAVHTSKEK